MFESRRSKRRTLKNLIKLSLFAFFFWLLIAFGFKHSNVDTNIGENLDRNQIERVIKVKNFETLASFEEQSKLSSSEESILKNFLSKIDQTTRNIAVNNEVTKIDHISYESSDSSSSESETAAQASAGGMEFPEIEKILNNAGEGGKAVTLPSPLSVDVQKLVNDSWKNFEFNEFVSSFISLKRSLPDFRADYCKDFQHSENLAQVSVIIVFYNEAWSTLLRSIHSILLRTPENLLNEIILVDDYSDMEHLKDQLEEYLKSYEKIKLTRNSGREGLIKSRNIGATLATSEILVFLDSHIECTAGWLEPLLDRISQDNTSVAAPMIHQINDNTFEMQPYEKRSYVALGGFSWNLQFKWFNIPISVLRHPQEPLKSPTLSGGLFAISKTFFETLGMYDPGLEVWGGENLELSFKTWMCGGRIEIVQCSHVGHVYRKKCPYEWKRKAEIIRRNSLRIAKVWMDDYIEYFYYATGFKHTECGDVSERVKLREELQCKSFEWYLQEVYPMRTVPSHGISFGRIESVAYNKSLCLNARASKDSLDLGIAECDDRRTEQFWEYNGPIYRDNYCVTYERSKLFTKHCRRIKNQLFSYNITTSQLYLKSFKKCLTLTPTLDLVMNPCKSSDTGQMWKLENLNEDRVKEF